MSSFVFVDAGVQDIDTLLAGLDEDLQVVLLDAGSDGIEQIARALQGITSLPVRRDGSGLRTEQRKTRIILRGKTGMHLTRNPIRVSNVEN